MVASEVARILAERRGLEIGEAAEIVRAFFGSMEEALAPDARIEIRGFGVFRLKRYPGYAGRNPKTGEAINIPGKVSPAFKPGLEFMKLVNREAK